MRSSLFEEINRGDWWRRRPGPWRPWGDCARLTSTTPNSKTSSARSWEWRFFWEARRREIALPLPPPSSPEPELSTATTVPTPAPIPPPLTKIRELRRRLLDRFKAIRTDGPSADATRHFRLNGATVMFGGRLNIFTDFAKAAKILAAFGIAVERKNVTRKLYKFVVGTDPPSKRLCQARQRRVKIITEPVFVERLLGAAARRPTPPPQSATTLIRGRSSLIRSRSPSPPTTSAAAPPFTSPADAIADILVRSVPVVVVDRSSRSWRE